MKSALLHVSTILRYFYALRLSLDVKRSNKNDVCIEKLDPIVVLLSFKDIACCVAVKGKKELHKARKFCVTIWLARK